MFTISKIHYPTFTQKVYMAAVPSGTLAPYSQLL